MTATTGTPKDDRDPAAAASERFDAFVSYSREDGALAAAVQDGLERLGKRWRSRRALRAFRDVANLGATPELWPSVRAALDGSRFLVLVASPVAARSEWVTREVEHFVGMRGADRLLLAIADGTCAWDATAGRFDSSTDCLPSPLLGAFAEEPAYVDLTWVQTGQQADLENPRFRAAIADLAAPIHGVERDELEAIDLREFRRGRRFRRGATVLVVALALATTVAAVLATRSAIESRQPARSRGGQPAGL